VTLRGGNVGGWKVAVWFGIVGECVPQGTRDAVWCFCSFSFSSKRIAISFVA
jgi:hypothetical protein